jgi:dihydrofolate synthase/folylpolyglutamate synthase
VLAVLNHAAARLGITPQIFGQDFHVHEEHGRLIYQDESGLLDLALPKLVGRHQHQNAATAIACLRALIPDLDAATFEQGLIEADWPARLQKLARGPLVDLAPQGAEVWLDGGHNEEGGRVLGQAMADFEEKAARPLVMICGSLSSKDTVGFLRSFSGLAREVLAVPISGEHIARTPREIVSAAAEVGIQGAACESVDSALRFLAVRDWPVPPRILIAGSLYLAGEVLRENETPPV